MPTTVAGNVTGNTLGTDTNSYNTVVGSSATMVQRLFAKTGNKILVQFGGVTVGLCQSVDVQEDFSPEPASGIGDISVVEYVPTMARYTVHVEEMVLNAGSLRSAGVTPGSADDMLKGNVFDIVFVDAGTLGAAASGAAPGLARIIKGCSYASGNVQIRKHAIVVSSAVFNALGATGTGA